MYMYILICSKNLVPFRFAEFFDKILPKQHETWPWQMKSRRNFATFHFVTKQKKSISGKPYLKVHTKPLEILLHFNLPSIVTYSG
jgi:hypothetical protein